MQVSTWKLLNERQDTVFKVAFEGRIGNILNNLRDQKMEIYEKTFQHRRMICPAMVLLNAAVCVAAQCEEHVVPALT